MPILNKDMQVCISLSARPSNLGTRFHNYLYDELGLNFIYKAFSTTDLPGAVAGIRALGFRGCSVSMPFKEAIIDLVDVMGASALAIESVNTVVNDDGILTAYNTDFEAVATALTRRNLDTAQPVLVRGSGGMAKAVVAAFRHVGFTDVTVVARNVEAGRSLAEKYGYAFATEGDAIGDSSRGYGMLVNVTPVGMAGGADADGLSFPQAQVEQASTVFDVIAFPSETPLILASERAGKQTISGAEIIALQAAIQFELYTGVALSDEQVAQASAFSREA
jgi:shikimate dehydrogenase